MKARLTVLTIVALGALAVVEVAVAKPMPVGSKITATATAALPPGADAYATTVTGKVTSAKAACRSGRTLKFKRTIPGPPGIAAVGKTKSDGTGAWSKTVASFLPGRGEKITIELQPKRVGDVLCSGAEKDIFEAKVEPPPE